MITNSDSLSNSSAADAVNMRNYGIDLLKIFSMMMIAVLHILGQGGVINYSHPLSASYEAAWFLETMAFGAVNCFAMASGYVGVKSKFKPGRIVELWLNVIFYTILITLLFSKIMPKSVEKSDWLKSCFPVCSSTYWYFTAYFGMCILSPVMNRGLSALNAHSAKQILAAIIIIFSFLPTITRNDIFITKYGYSMIWLVILYIAGGCLNIASNSQTDSDQKHKINTVIMVTSCMTICIICIFSAWKLKYALEKKPFVFFGETISNKLFIQYTSPFVLIASAALLLVFSKIKISGKIAGKIIIFISSLTFSVYLIHVHPLVWDNIMKNRFTSYAKLQPFHLVIKVLGTAAAIWAVCSAIDIIRWALFHLLRIRKLCDKITCVLSR